MPSDINYDDLCNLIANKVKHASIDSTKKYLRATYEVILEQLELNNRIYFKDFGYWEIKPRKSGERVINDPVTNKKRLVYVKPKFSIFFKPSIIFDQSVNENNFKILKHKVKPKKKKSVETFVDLLNRAQKRKEIRDNGKTNV